MIFFKVLKEKSIFIIISILTLIIILSLTTYYVFANNNEFEEEYVNVPIIMYHSLLNARSNRYIIHPNNFENDLKYIQENGYTTITMTDLINYVYENAPLPEKPIIITFDDGCYNNLTYAVPLLKKYNMKAVISVVGEYTDNFTNRDDANTDYGYLRWKDINSLIEDGSTIEFQNHSYSLHSTKKGRRGCLSKWNESYDDYKNYLSNDLNKLQEEFREMTGYVPNTFTYPFGSMNDDSEKIIKELGFKASLSCQEGINKITKNTESLYSLKRYNRPYNTSTENFFRKIENAKL